jgi:hypothetical protein
MKAIIDQEDKEEEVDDLNFEEVEKSLFPRVLSLLEQLFKCSADSKYDFDSSLLVELEKGFNELLMKLFVDSTEKVAAEGTVESVKSKKNKKNHWTWKKCPGQPNGMSVAPRKYWFLCCFGFAKFIDKSGSQNLHLKIAMRMTLNGCRHIIVRSWLFLFERCSPS